MKRAIAAALFLLVWAPALFSIDSGDFDAVADFSVTIKTLSQLDEATANAYGLMNRFLLLDGTVTNILILDGNEESYLVQVELVSGEWIGLEEVRSYSCWVLFSGPRFASVFPARVPRTPPPEVIESNDHILIVAVALQTVEIAEGETAWVLEGIHARPLR
ncbi:MAG: hypothetical protein JSV89_09785 [Spirochaetaceae bacterium]|nr:MAG: hypothetical protein JSV89_09785 [Spirochaetaceae bacterium]